MQLISFEPLQPFELVKNIGVASDHDFLSHDHACSASLGAYIPDDSDLCLEAFLASRDNERGFENV